MREVFLTVQLAKAITNKFENFPHVRATMNKVLEQAMKGLSRMTFCGPLDEAKDVELVFSSLGYEVIRTSNVVEIYW